MKFRFDFERALRAIVWGLAHCSERYVLETCIAVMFLGMLGLYALAANSLVLCVMFVVVLALLCAVLNRVGMKYGPPQDDDDDSSTG